MKIILDGNSNSGGVYKISNLTNGRIYIGSTYRFKKRYTNHNNQLKSNSHKNTFLQNDYNKCGPNSFLFEVIEVIEDKESRILAEQVLIDEYYDNQKQCYNLRKDAQYSREGKKNNFPTALTDKRKQKQSEENIAKRSEGMKKFYLEHPEEKQKLSKRAKEVRWKNHDLNLTITHQETGEVVVINGSLKEWCETNGQSYKAFSQLVNGKIKTSGGWFVGTEMPKFVNRKGEKRKPLTLEQRNKKSNGKYEGRIIFNEETKETIVLPRNLKQFSRERCWHYNSLIKLLNKECKRVYGFIAYDK
jgi:group I intron endonuclease